MATFASQLASRGPFSHPAPASTHVPPAGTFIPGTKVQVGNHRVVVEKYLSEGGFAHVYVVRLPRTVDGENLAVLKRVAVPDTDHLASMRTEVETMKRLRGHRNIVKYIDSHASQLKGGGYEVFLLMEYCSGGGLIDFMNTRLQNRLTEPEILKIFTDVAEGVACMHYLKPPLLHRDLKVENVLISTSGSTRTYKLCDFGSAAPPRPAATSAAEGRLIEDDVQRHTTLQYRSPEMVDVYRKQPIDEKSDIWALGVLLYKLCYYTTPFEEVGQMAILNASFKYPNYPAFSDGLKLLIATMLREQPAKRPNIYQVLQKTCQMQGKEVPIRDIYTGRTQSETRQNQRLPQPPSNSQSRAGATLSPPAQPSLQPIPDITPMRRGRPEKPVSHHSSAKPSPSPLRMIDSTDPFASLDSGKAQPVDELSSRFPTLDQFSLLTDKGKTFDFAPASEKKETSTSDLARRITNALADDAFVRSPSPPKPAATPLAAPSATAPLAPATSRTVSEQQKALEAKDRPPAKAKAPAIVQKKPVMVSTGTMTSPSPAPASLPRRADRASYRFPSSDDLSRSKSQPQPLEKPRILAPISGSGTRLANLLKDDAMRSQGAPEWEPRSPTSSRPSLEGGRPSMKELDVGLQRSRSLNTRSRPLSVNLGAGPTHIQDQEIKMIGPGSLETDERDMSDLTEVESDTNIASDVDFLKAKEEEEKTGRKLVHIRLGSGSKHGKRASLPSLSFSGTKNLLSGRFGDAFRKFEGNDASNSRSRSPSPSERPINNLTPIAGSEATDLSDDRHAFEETEELSPEMRRELEKHRLEAEERRVAQAAADYRRRLAEKPGAPSGGIGRAASIQNKVQSLLKENDKPAVKTAAGYGHYTDQDVTHGHMAEQSHPSVPSSGLSLRPQPSQPIGPPPYPHSAPSSAVSLAAGKPSARPPQKPPAPPKPEALRTGRGELPAEPSAMDGTEALGPDDWEANFSRRYPSLSGLEMVETEIDVSKTRPPRTKEV